MALETDPHRLQQRQKQIDFGLATIGYANYVAWLSSNKGSVKPIPLPNIHAQCSKRTWDAQIKHWRRLLHLWDNVEPPTGTPQDVQFRDPCAQENVEFVDDDAEEFLEDAGWQKAQRPQRSTQFYSQCTTSTSQLYLQYPTSTSQLYMQPTAYTGNPYSQNQGLPDGTINYSSVHPSTPSFAWQPSTTAVVPFGGQYFQLQATNAPQSLHPYQQALFPVPTQMPQSPQYSQAPHPRWSGGNPQPRWSGSARPDRLSPPHPSRGRRDQPIPAHYICVADQEAAVRSRIVAAEEGAIQELIFQQYCSALVAASGAQRQLAIGSATSGPLREWPHPELRKLLASDFDASQRPAGARGSSELPPSLADPTLRASSPASDTSRSLVDLQLDEERYSNFRRHFREAPSTTMESLDTPPPCWSPARLTPGLQGNRGPPSSSPGLTPSPAEWLAAHRSPGPVSPRAALAFNDWASPQDGPSQATKAVLSEVQE
jgi:hypothetical protein